MPTGGGSPPRDRTSAAARPRAGPRGSSSRTGSGPGRTKTSALRPCSTRAASPWRVRDRDSARPRKTGCARWIRRSAFLRGCRCWEASFLRKCSSDGGSFAARSLPKARDPSGDGLSRDRREGLIRRGKDRFGAPEGRKEHPNPPGAETWNREKRALERALPARAPMRLQAESMRLVARSLEELEARVRPCEHDRGRTAGHEHLFFAFREPGCRHPDAEAVERRERRRELPLAPVDQEQVGQWPPLLHRARVTARHGLGDRRQVVDARPVDAKEAVLVLCGLAVHEDDAGGIRLISLQMRDVETLDPGRAAVEVERLCERERRLLAALPHRSKAPEMILARVVAGDLHALERRSAARRLDRDARPFPLREPRLDGFERLFGQVDGQQDVARQESRRVVKLREKRDPEFLRWHVAELLPEVLARVEDDTPAHEEDGRGDVAPVGEIAEHVEILARHALHP